MSGLEQNYQEGFVARLAAREKQIQQHYRPVISVHKWFARRPGSLFRALALAEFVNGPVSKTYSRGHEIGGVCLDPFMGGGTPVFEAARLGMSVIGFDTNPMARWIVERELEDVDPDELAATGETIASEIDSATRALYVTDCTSCGEEATVRYFIWIRHHRCTGCSRESAVLSDTMIVSTKLGRHPREVHVCPSCLAVSECRPGRRPRCCASCKKPYDAHLVPTGSLQMCECGVPFTIPPHGTVEEPLQKLVAVEYDCSRCRARRGATAHTYKEADVRDHERVAEAERIRAKKPSPFWPTDELIPDGQETARLLKWGYLRWIDLFNGRQLYGLGLLAARIDAERDGPVKRALQTIFSDFLRYQNMLCRYDRQGLKPSDIFSLHGFPVPRVACEVALVGTAKVGSGGFRHALAKYVRAKRWCREPYEKTDQGKNRRTSPEIIASTFVKSPSRLGRAGSAYLKRGSLQVDELEEGSVDIVLTDPPYFANVQYGELMDFCYVWLRRLAPKTPFFKRTSTKTDDDAVGSGSEGSVDIVEFTGRLSTVFEAAAKALKPGAPFCFTYHHNDLDAYAPLVVACLNAGLVPTAVFASPSEMRSSTHIHKRNAATVDTLFVLRKPPIQDPSHRSPDDDIVGIRRHLAALRRVGLKPTDADRDCLRSGQLAARAMVELADDWPPATDPAQLFALASTTLRRLAGRPVPTAVAVL
jgi:adenine-specific DNA methylase